ncbi:hypothetical protein GCM10007881_60720 [Mesorhizobium huakuii]|nr:hypothetical protein GCM10007881_60720 [Mesorhizobium huakuii]
MCHHCKDSDIGRGTDRDHALPRITVISLFSMALDTGDADEFSFGKAGGSACFRGLCPCEQGKVAVAS